MTQIFAAPLDAPPSAPMPPTVAPQRPAAARPRLGWLDALRGFAALVVVYYHISPHLPIAHRQVFSGWLMTGRYGVLLFFVVSGYVIAMSLERYGSLRRFWIGRIFRIYPAWLLAAGVMGLAIVADLAALRTTYQGQAAAVGIGHLTMLQELLGIQSFVYVFWTLSYEMVFYVLVSALFVLNLHRRSAWWAMGLAVGALLGGPFLPDGLFSNGSPGRSVLAVVTALLLAGTILAYVSGRRGLALPAALAGLTLVALPTLNGRPGPSSQTIGSWQALSFLALMFAGMVFYAGQQGLLPRRTAVLALTAVLGCLLAAAWLHTDRPWQSAAEVAHARGEAIGTLLVVVASFAVAFSLRHRRMPGWATWLGKVSYSLYLLHPLVLMPLVRVFPGTETLPVLGQLGVGALYLAAVLGLAEFSYRFVEKPGQALGKRVARAVDRRLGPDRTATRRAAPATAPSAVPVPAIVDPLAEPSVA